MPCLPAANARDDEWHPVESPCLSLRIIWIGLYTTPDTSSDVFGVNSLPYPPEPLNMNFTFAYS